MSHEIKEFGTFFPGEFGIDVDIKSGGQAYVEICSHPVHGNIAIKRYIGGHCDKEATLLMQNANHQNIIQFIGILIDEQSQWIGYIMPYMPMGSLNNIIHNIDKTYDRNIYTSEQVTSWITQICLGLSHLHSNNIIHRDIKPSNVLLGQSLDDVKLSDFGIARSLETITHSLTTGAGTSIYMAPEMFEGENYNIFADTYSLSITIWEILYRRYWNTHIIMCFRVPFDHVMAQNMLEFPNKIANGERPEVKSDLSQEVSNLLTICWNADPSLRPTIDDIVQFSRKIGFQVPGRETIILLGGRDTNKYLDSMLVLQNNGENDENWKELTIKLPYTVRNHGAQFLNDNLYTFGGKNIKDEILNCMYKLSKNLTWEKMAEMNEKRWGISSSNVILNDQIWVLGGENGKEVLRSVEMYNPRKNEWKYKRGMNECRILASAAVVNGKIFCCGGDNNKKRLSSVEYYDPFSDSWTLICDMPYPIDCFGAVGMDNNLFAIGGYNERDLSSVLVLDTADNNAEWIEKSRMLRQRCFFSIAKIGDKVFICGGQSNKWVVPFVEIFDGKIWREGPMLTSSRQHAAAAVISMSFAKCLEYKSTIPQHVESKHRIDNSLEFIEASSTIGSNLEKQTIFLVGGGNGSKYFDSLLILQVNEDNEENWKELTIKLPYVVYEHGAQFLKNNLYIFGGCDENNEILMSMYKLSKRFQWSTLSKGLQWDEIINMNEKRCGISNSNVVLNDRIWVIGGWNGKETLKSVEMYNPVANKWEYVKEMNKCRSRAAAAIVNGKIFCCGGYNGMNLLNSAECYDPSSDTWVLIRHMPEHVKGHGTVEIDRNLVVIGGSTGREPLGAVWVLDTSDKNAEWVEKPWLPVPRCNFSIAKIDGKIFVCGGDSKEGKVDTVEIFDGQGWTIGPKLITPLYSAAAVVVPIDYAKYLENQNTEPKIKQIKSNSQNTHKATQFPKMFTISLEKKAIILLGGGSTKKFLNSILILQRDGESDENWIELPLKLPHAICFHGAQFLNDYLYIFGGEKTTEEPLNSAYKLSKNLNWEKIMDMNQKRAFILNSSVILNNQIWVCGGCSEEGLKSVEMYNPHTNEWTYMKEMNEYRVEAAAAVVNGKIFCCGGLDGEGYLQSAECYDPSSDSWTLISNMPLPSGGLGAVTMDGKLMVIGGKCTRTNYLNSVWILDTSDKNAEWIEKPSMSLRRSNFSITKIGNKIYVCGGKSEDGEVDDVEMFDGDIWKYGPKLIAPRAFTAATVVSTNILEYLENNNAEFSMPQAKPTSENVNRTIQFSKMIEKNLGKETVLLLGGYDGAKRVDRLQILENNGESWKELTTKLPYALYGHGVQFLKNNLYIFGGENAQDESLNCMYKISRKSPWHLLFKGLQWEKMADMNDKRNYISNSSVILNDRIWVLGGCNGKEVLKTVEMYNPYMNQWTYKREMNECRGCAAAAVVNGNIFCCGGSNGQALSSVECYDPSSDIWTLIPNLPQPSGGLGTIEVDGHLVVIGGYNGREELSHVWVLDTTDGNAKWIEKQCMSFPHRDFSIAKMNGKVFVCGGHSKEEIIDEVEIFNGKIWKNGPKLRIPQVCAAATIVSAEFAKYLK